MEEEVITSVCVKTLYSERTGRKGRHWQSLGVLMCMVQNMKTLPLKDYMTMTYLVLSAKPHEDPCWWFPPETSVILAGQQNIQAILQLNIMDFVALSMCVWMGKQSLLTTAVQIEMVSFSTQLLPDVAPSHVSHTYRTESYSVLSALVETTRGVVSIAILIEAINNLLNGACLHSF